MPKRITRKLDLEILLSKVKPHPTPSASLEQYMISVNAAADMLYLAAYTYNDIVDKTILDLGCGSGRLALGAAFLGAKETVGVDIDKTALKIASTNSASVGLKDRVQWVAADIDTVWGEFDTVLQNPPFGVQQRGADRKFLEKALKTGKAIFSIHKGTQDSFASTRKANFPKDYAFRVSPRSFLREFIEKNGGTIKAIHPMAMTIPYMFDFHTKEKHKFAIDLYVIEGRQKKHGSA